MPCLRATMTGDTPCCRLSAAISRFCSAVQRRRRSRPVITSMRRLRMLVRLVVGVSSESNATAITLSSFLKDDRWPNFPRAAQCAAAISLTLLCHPDADRPAFRAERRAVRQPGCRHGQIPDEAAGRVGPQARGEAGGGRLTRDALASSGADICDGARRWDTTRTPTAAGAAADALERLVRARMDAEIRGLHVPELIPTCSRRWRRRSCRSRCLGARWRTRSTPRLLWWPGSACGGWLRIRPKGTTRVPGRQNLTSKQ